MGKKLYRTRQQNGTKSGGSGGATLKKFTAPTPGLEDVFFTWGTAKDAAKFEDMVSQLANYVGTRNWTKSSVASKAMSAIEAPVIAGPDRPVREYWEDQAQQVRTNSKTGGAIGAPVANEPVVDDWEHDLNVEEYKIKLRAFREQEAAWNENKAKCYYLVLSHCPKELETELRNNSRWEEMESN